MDCRSVIPDQTLQLAKKLASQNDDEVALRAAIGRAYYSAFYYGKQVADKCPDPESKAGGVHERVVCSLEQVPLSSLGGKQQAVVVRRIGKWLRVARTLRVDADYMLDKTLTIEDYKKAESLAKKIARDSKAIIEDLHS